MAEVKPAEFARQAGVSPSVISRKISNKTLIRNNAGFLDTDNPVNARYLSKRRLKANNAALEDDGKAAERVIKNTDFSAMADAEIAEHAGLPQRLLKMTIRELVIKYRGLDGIDRYIKMLRDLTAADEKDQKVQERRLQLVEKDFVTARVIEYLNVLMKQLLEYPGSAVDGIISLVQSEGSNSRQDVTRMMESGLSKIIKGSKEQVIKEMDGLRAKYQEKDDDLREKIKEAVEEVIDE
jgi:hypothetical protein